MSARVHLPLPKYEETDLFEHEGRSGCALRKNAGSFPKRHSSPKVKELSVCRRRGAVGTASKFDFYGRSVHTRLTVSMAPSPINFECAVCEFMSRSRLMNLVSDCNSNRCD